MKTVTEIKQFAIFLKKIISSTTRGHIEYKNVFNEVFMIGVESLPIVIFVSAFIGTNLALQGYNAFKSIGGQNLVGIFVSLAGLREMAPIVAGAMVGAKSGSAIAANLATMKIKEQIDALAVMSVDPIAYLIIPKFIAVIITLPLLVLIANFFCIFSGYYVAIYQLNVGSGIFLDNIRTFTSLSDVGIGLLKGLTFGLTICTVACYCGLNSGPGPEGVGKATNRAVVVGCVLCIVLNYFVTAIFYD